MEKSEYQLLKAEWVQVLVQLWDAYGKPVNPKQLKTYIQQFGDVPLGVLEHVVEETLRKHQFNSVPTIGEVKAVLHDTHPYYQESDYVHKPMKCQSIPVYTLDEYRQSWGVK